MTQINFNNLFELNRKIKVAIVGSRDFNDFDLLKDKINPIFLKLEWQIDSIVSGGARGTDSMAEKYAKDNKISTIIYRPDWEKHGNSAGIIRNRTIIQSSDLVIAFLMDNSRGTTNSINVAKKLKKELIVFNLK